MSKRKSGKRQPPKKQNTRNTRVGTMRMHPRGFGFVVSEDPEQKDVFIPKHLTRNAVDGDLVEVTAVPSSKPEKGPEGEVLAIIKRERTHLAGIIASIEGETIIARVPLLGEQGSVLVKNKKKSPLKVGDRLIFKVLQWGDDQQSTVCEPHELIGHISDPSCDIKAAVAEYNLSSSFSKKVIEEAKAFGTKVKPAELKGRLDLTKIPSITIDPDTARDFDDALSIEKNKKGHFWLTVHIADVAHYVKADSLLDQEAIKRSNSTYFPGACIPMLPEELSNNLCSLRQGVIRLTVSVLMEFDPDGNLIAQEVKRSFIKSKKRFTYGEAKEILDGKKSPLAPMLHQMVELCQLLKKKRSERGSIDFSLPELILLLDKNGQPTGVKVEEYHIAHQLVEEFMLKANEVVAQHLHAQGKSLLFRVHEEPESENLDSFFATARSLGFSIPAKPTHTDLQRLFEQAKNTPFSQQLAVGFIRNLKLAIYSPQNVGHFGLALDYYCHFTSPIRRYSDLIIQRLLFDEEGEKLNLERIGKDCSEKERISFRAEMGVKILKKHRLLLSWQKEDPTRHFVGYVTKIKPFGLYFEIKELFLEGFLHISELENDYFIFDPRTSTMQGERTGIKHVVGEEITVRPIRVDLIHQETSWELCYTPPGPK
ncbi:MAG: VacB/RNase II family 3'-5' exoribonuclease [Verrucomicrobia bacterium]|nr:VacB/RNase II family 3'-5' exoribonuclease [Verrucomicrobiota bacterium]